MKKVNGTCITGTKMVPETEIVANVSLIGRLYDEFVIQILRFDKSHHHNVIFFFSLAAKLLFINFRQVTSLGKCTVVGLF